MNASSDMPQQDPYYPHPGVLNASTFYQQGLETNAIKYRLDNDGMLQRVELFLRSAKVISKQDENGEVIEEMVRVAKPLMNEEGVQAVMGYLHMTVGPHNVQGNLDRDQYDGLIYEINVYLAEIVMSNLVNWGIREEDYNLIIDTMMTTLQLFLSRTINNGERASYGQSMLTKETSVLGSQGKRGFFDRIFGG